MVVVLVLLAFWLGFFLALWLRSATPLPEPPLYVCRVCRSVWLDPKGEGVSIGNGQKPQHSHNIDTT